MASIGYSTLSVIPSARGFGKSLSSQVDPQLASAGKSGGSRLSGALGGVLVKSALGIGVAAGGILGTALFKGFERLSAIEEARAKLSGLGNSAKSVDKIMTNALASVKGTAFGLGDAATIAASAVAAGIKPGRQLESTLKLVADAATIGGTSLGEMGAIFNKVATSNKVQGDVINQLNDKGIPIVQLLGKTMGKTSGEVTALATKGKIDFKTFQTAMASGLGGAALKSGNTFKGAFANMNAALGRFGASLLTGVFPVVKNVFGNITGFLDTLTAKVGPFADAFAAKLPAAFATIGASLSGVFSTIGSAIKAVDFGAIGSKLAPLVTAFKGFVSNVGTAAATIAPALVSIVRGLTPIAKLAVGVAITAIATAFDLLGPALNGLATGFAAVTSFVANNQTTFAVIAGTITTLLVPALVLMGVQATITAAKSVVAWIATSAGAATSAVLTVGFMTLVAAGWVMLGAKALLGAAKMAAAWLIALGPIGLVIAAIAAVVAVVILNWDTIKAKTVAAWTAVRVAVSSAVNIVRSAVSGAFNAVRGSVSGAMNSVRSTVSNAIGNVVGLFSGLIGRIRGALSGAGSALVSVGSNIVNGLISGIRAMGGAIGKALVALLPGPLKKFAGALGIASPSKVFATFGKFVGQGFVNGIVGTRAQVASTFEKLAKLASDTHNKGIQRLVASARPKLLGLASAYEAATARSKLAVDKLTALRDSAAQLSASVSDSVIATGNFAGAGSRSFAGIITQLTGAGTAASTFAAVMAKLKASGLDPTTVSQLIGAGPAALGAAQSILDSGAAGIAQIKALQTSLAASAKSLGTTAANSLYATGIAAAAGLVRGLRSQEAALVRQMKRIADLMADTIKKKLQIHSPSRLFEGFGINTGRGLAIGVDKSGAGVEASMQRLVSSVAAPRGVRFDASAMNGTNGSAGGPGITQNIFPQPQQSEVEIGRASANALQFAMAR